MVLQMHGDRAVRLYESSMYRAFEDISMLSGQSHRHWSLTTPNHNLFDLPLLTAPIFTTSDQLTRATSSGPYSRTCLISAATGR